jgi:HD superfamily phosphodiesterase
LRAIRPRLDPELCSAAGMLHDIWKYKFKDFPEHDRLGAVEVRKILTGPGTYSSPMHIRRLERVLSQLAVHPAWACPH